MESQDSWEKQTAHTEGLIRDVLTLKKIGFRIQKTEEKFLINCEIY